MKHYIFRVEDTFGYVLYEQKQFHWLPSKGTKLKLNDTLYIVADLIQHEYEPEASVYGTVILRSEQNPYLSQPFLDSPQRSKTTIPTVQKGGHTEPQLKLKATK